MRITAISDMHGNLGSARAALDLTEPDLILCCGDWGDPGEVNPADLQSITAKARVLTVYGNHDDLDVLSAARNTDGSPALLSPGEIREVGGLRFAGISGIWAKSHQKPYYVTDEDVAHQASLLAGRGVDILLTHGCPIGLADGLPGGRRGGQRCFLDAFHAIMPRIHLCGHLHFPQMRNLSSGRVVVNVGYTCEGDYWVLQIGPQEVEARHYKL
jgi:Icc-related predicted phosphoesterase